MRAVDEDHDLVVARLVQAEVADAGRVGERAPQRAREDALAVELEHLVGAALHLHNILEPIRGESDFSRMSNLSESPDINYAEDYLHGVHELRRAIRVCQRRLGDVTAPALVIQTDGDPVVAPVSADRLLGGLGSSTTFPMRVPGDRHVIVRGAESDGVFDRVRRFVDHVSDR